MCARAQRKARRSAESDWWRDYRLDGLLLVGAAAYVCFALSGPSPAWTALWRGEPGLDVFAAANPAGPVGSLIAFFLRALGGKLWCWLFPALLSYKGFWRLLAGKPAPHGLPRRMLALWLVSTTWLAQPSGPLDEGQAGVWAGAPGLGLARGVGALFGLWGGRILLSTLLLITIAWVSSPWLAPVRAPLRAVGRATGTTLRAIGSGARRTLQLLLTVGRATLRAAGAGVAALFRRAHGESRRDAGRATVAAHMAAGTVADHERRPRRRVHLAPAVEATATHAAGESSEWQRAQSEAAAAEQRSTVGCPAAVTQTVEDRAGGTVTTAVPPAPASPAAETGGGDSAAEFPEHEPPRGSAFAEAVLLDVGLLRDPVPEAAQLDRAGLDAAADLLEATLRSFGVEGEVKDVRPGPVVTTFEYQPAAGIKISQIVQRTDDLALAMRARSIRMEAPIPGKAAVGIEIPNPTPQVVWLKDVITEAQARLQEPLSVALGRDVVGQPVVIDIARLPHLLVAGSTGSGKSVCLNTIICNLLLRSDPRRLRLLLVDPKMLELNVYNGIPHLLLPVVTDPKEALRAFRWLEAQMDHRYRRLARHAVRNIEGYNARVTRGEIVDEEGIPIAEPMPYYLAIVDELADLMLQLGQEFELPVTRLAQKARAVGIHLILATQRPSVNVITGVIKANLPCRIAFRVIQKNDSRTILDMNGAERLLGHGDMLYLMPGRAQPLRVHGAFLDLEECERIAGHWRQYADLTTELSLAGEERPEGSDIRGEDELFEAAKRVVVLHQSGSTSLLQRRLRIGYTRAGRLMDMLEEAGVVGPFTGSKARDVLWRPDDLGAADDLLAREEEE